MCVSADSDLYWISITFDDEIITNFIAMNKILVICMLGIALTVSIVLEDIVKTIRTKRMVKKTINGCFRAIEEKEGRLNDR